MPPATSALVPQTYAALRREVEMALLTGQRQIEQAKVRTYWETGRLIGEHLRLNESKPGYGTATMAKLAHDLKVSDSVLYRCVRFVESFPNLATWPNLTWAHYRVLVPVEPPSRRLSLTKQADKEGWTVAELDERIRPLRLADADTPAPKPEPLVPRRGTPGLCKVAATGDTLAVDLGFACFLDLPSDTKLKAGDCVQLDASGLPSPDSQPSTLAPSFTYSATVLSVVDGDTLWVKIYLRPGQWVKQKLRLRDLDCPEMDTPEGKAAKRFVETLVRNATAVTICTTKPDKYDRYLADVFLALADGTEVFLNNALLGNGHAVVKRAWEFADWGG